MKRPLLNLLRLSLGLLPLSLFAYPVEVREVDGQATLYRNGAPYTIRGAGGDHDMELLAKIGGNSVRTWGAPDVALLDRAHALGLTVCVGLWVEHERHGFDYDDEEAVEAQFQRHKEAIDRLAGHPAILIWGIGNEVELQYTNVKVWDLVERLAAYIKKVDTGRPTMTVTAHVEHKVVEEIVARCPSIDLLGVNSYGGVGVLRKAVPEAGWTKPYVVTEWGVDGPWEVDETSWGAEIEPSSTEKAYQFALRYATIQASPMCLGSYVFHWGAKQENTPTWFNLFLGDGSRKEAVEFLQYAWSGTYPENPTPRIAALRINHAPVHESLVLRAGDKGVADFVITRGHQDDLAVHWEILPESTDKRLGGDAEERPDPVSFDTFGASRTHLDFEVPSEPGPYRLFLYVRNGTGGAATANYPFRVVPASERTP